MTESCRPHIWEPTVCSDYHKGPRGHPAGDDTAGWTEKWAAVPEPKLCLGDMNELWQFTREEIGELAPTHVEGNHDKGSLTQARWLRMRDDCKELYLDYGVLSGFPIHPHQQEIRIGDTIFLHGHRFDPWLYKFVGRPVTWLVGKLECVWPDADIELGGWFSRKFRAGRHGDWQRYIVAGARYAAKKGARQIVFGHLHALLDRWVTVRVRRRNVWVHVVCTGCCCNGRLDFVRVRVKMNH